MTAVSLGGKKQLFNYTKKEKEWACSTKQEAKPSAWLGPISAILCTASRKKKELSIIKFRNIVVVQTMICWRRRDYNILEVAAPRRNSLLFTKQTDKTSNSVWACLKSHRNLRYKADVESSVAENSCFGKGWAALHFFLCCSMSLEEGLFGVE